jgi:hypothetical protein
MPIAAQCPNCGGPLSETSVLALAPVCERCGTVITKIGGTLGLTSAYGINDPTITRKRVEADLAVFCDYRNKYVGMLEACKEQLNWGVERYAKFPNPPELLPVVEVPPLGPLLWWSFVWGVGTWFCVGIVCVVLYFPLMLIGAVIMGSDQAGKDLAGAIAGIGPLIALIVPSAVILSPHFKAWAANGKRPVENARRQKAYEEARASALKAAEPVKAAQDHRLRCQIREVEGLITTVTEKAEDVRRLLRTL